MTADKSGLGKLAVAALVLVVLVIGLGMLMPALKSAREVSQKRLLSPRTLGSERDYALQYEADTNAWKTETADTTSSLRPPGLRAAIKKYDAEISLTPKLSVGTATPESIYVADFKATLEARAPETGEGKCQIELPLPPQIISLANVEFKVNGDPTDDFGLGQNRLVWQGALDKNNTSQITVTYSAVGKGIYTLDKPSGRIIEHFQTKLIANQSNIRMMELSLQPTKLERSSDKTTYTWEYERLVAARPIAIDVLGIAAIDQLGELTWLGPISVFVFGVVITLVALTSDPGKLTGWLVVMVVGCFAGAYPLMYFLQDFISLTPAIVLSAAGVIAVIAWRVISLFGVRHGVFGGILLPVIVLVLTVSATVHATPALQGVLMTALAIFGLVTAMVLLPKAQKKLTEVETLQTLDG